MSKRRKRHATIDDAVRTGIVNWLNNPTKYDPNSTDDLEVIQVKALHKNIMTEINLFLDIHSQ